MLFKVRHIVASFFLLLSLVVVTPPQLFHSCHHHTDISHEGHNHAITHVERASYHCPACDFQFSGFIEPSFEKAVQENTYTQQYHIACYSAAYTSAVLNTEGRGPPQNSQIPL